MILGCGHAGDGNVHLSVFQSGPGAARTGAAQRLRRRVQRSVVRCRVSTASAPTNEPFPRPRESGEARAHGTGSRRRSIPTASSIQGRCSSPRRKAAGGRAMIGARGAAFAASWRRVWTWCSPIPARRRCTSSPPSTPFRRCAVCSRSSKERRPAQRTAIARMRESARRGAAASRARPRQRTCQSPQRAAQPRTGGRDRRRPRDVSRASTTRRCSPISTPWRATSRPGSGGASTPEDAGADAAAAVAAACGPPGQVATLILPADVSWSEGGSVAPAEPRSASRSGPRRFESVAAALRSRREQRRSCSVAARSATAGIACRLPHRCCDRGGACSPRRSRRAPSAAPASR